MSASQQTTNYGFPKFLGTDKPAWLVDFNGAMVSIDSTIKTVEDLSSGLSGQITQNTSDITDLETDLGNAQSLIATNTTDILILNNTKAPITNPNFVGNVYANGLNLLLLKNAIINGGFQVNQRAKSGTVILNAGEYGHDRWKAGSSGCTYTFNTVENLTTITITAGSLIQVIEGLNLETDTYTLAWEGTAQGKIGAGSYGASGLTGSVTGGSNLNIEFNIGTISKVRFNRGSAHILWQTEAYADVLRQCQRYYLHISNDGGQYTILGSMTADGTPYAHLVVNFPVDMRISPTSITTSAMSSFYWTGPVVGNTPTSITINTKTTRMVDIVITKTNAFSIGASYMLLSNNLQPAFIGISAEL